MEMFVSILGFEMVEADVKAKVLSHFSPFSHLNNRGCSAPTPKHVVFYMRCWIRVSKLTRLTERFLGEDVSIMEAAIQVRASVDSSTGIYSYKT